MSDSERHMPGKAGGDPGESQAEARLRELVLRAGGASKLGRVLGVSRNTIYDWSAGRTKIPFNAAVRVAEIAGVSLDWVATGQGSEPALPPNLVTNAKGLSAEALRRAGIDGPAVRDIEREATEQIPEGFLLVPSLEVRASAGPGQEVAQVNLVAEPQIALHGRWLRNLGIAHGNAEFVLADGDSMEPTIKHGDMMLVDRGYGRVIDGKIYVLVVNGLVLVKRVNLLAVGGLMLISDNERYPTQTIPASDVNDLNIEARVAWYGRVV